MRAFKYRDESQLSFVLDIIANRRLFCSDLESLNDPTEGSIQRIYWGRFKRPRSELNDLISSVAICSLSLTIRNTLLWGHYAGGMRGAAIEVQIPEPVAGTGSLLANRPVVKPMDYGEPQSIMYARQPLEQLILMKLSRKQIDWEYEQEVRIIAPTDTLEEGKFYHLPAAPRSVVLGNRMSMDTKKRLFHVCRNNSIPIYMAEHDGYSNSISVHTLSEERALQGAIWKDDRGVSNFESLVAFK